MQLQFGNPAEIERQSFDIIGKELGETHFQAQELEVVKRVIHTTADFDYANTLVFQNGAVEKAIQALRQGFSIITDTTMVQAGINKRVLQALGGRVECFIADTKIAQEAKQRNITRSMVAMEYAAKDMEHKIMVVGNAPTALIRLHEIMMHTGNMPALVVGVPVGFVNVIESKQLFLDTQVPCIIARGRKGGSTVAAAIINALLYLIH